MGTAEVISISRTDGLAIVIAAAVVAVLVIPLLAVMVQQVRRQGNLVYNLAAGLHGNGNPDDKGLRGDVQRVEATVKTLAAEVAEDREQRIESDALFEERLKAGNGQFETLTEKIAEVTRERIQACARNHPEATLNA